MFKTGRSRNQGRRSRGGLSRGARLRRWLLRALLIALTGALGLLLALLLLFKYVDPPTWSWRIHRALNPPAGYPDQVWHRWVGLDAIPLSVQLAVVASEDQRFPLHGGIDTHAIGEAIGDALEGERLRGASTLTQQTAKNLLLWPGRDWLRKGLELPLALALELIWGKARILEVYLNIVEFGPGVYGVQAAGEYWFGTPVERLSGWQAARLAAVLPNPWQYRAEPPGPYILTRSRWIQRQMAQLGDNWLAPIRRDGVIPAQR